MLLLPFHGFISTWGGTTIGPLWLWKAWKEILLTFMVILTAIQLLRDRPLLKILLRSWVTRVIMLYGVLHIVATLLVGNQIEPLAAGLAINLRIVSFFLVSQTIFSYLKVSRRELLAVIAIPLSGVVLFGLLQMFLLPYDFLVNFGYNVETTIAPFNTIDQQLDQLRIMSTTRGPNPLGAYLILPILLLVANIHTFLGRIWNMEEGIWKKGKLQNKKTISYLLFSISYLLSALVVLYGSHSRSAWVGFVLSAGVFILMSAPKKIRVLLITLGLMTGLISGLLAYQYRETSFVQNVIIHDNPEIGPEVTSNSERRSAYTKATSDISQRPLLGCAPGCAGPASFYDPDGARLSENYYLQVGQEIGVFGMLLFVTFIILVAKELYQRREDKMSLVLLASLVGISVANVFLHVWADDTLAYVWWGVAGAFLALHYKHKRD